jgi:hypothetical protein
VILKQTNLIPFFLIFGIYSITSMNYQIDSRLYFLQYLVLFVGLTVFICLQRKLPLNMSILSISMISVLLIYTLITANSSFQGDLRIGGFIPYIVFALLLITNLKNVKLDNSIIKLFNIVNIINIALAVAQIISLDFVNNIVRNFYAFGSLRVIGEMIYYHKPIITFGSHSIAGFYCYIFFFLNFKTYSVTKIKKNYIFALCYLLILFFLNSVTGLIFLLIAFIQLMLFTRKTRYFILLLIPLIIGFDIGNVKTMITEQIQVKMAASGSGILGRYSETGVLQYNLSQIKENPFNGIGLYFSDNFYGTDSGYIIYWLRGSLFLLLLVYLGLLFFIKRNLHSKKTAYFIWFIFMSFEFGFPNLFYFRTLCLLPFIIVFINFLDNYKYQLNRTTE